MKWLFKFLMIGCLFLVGCATTKVPRLEDGSERKPELKDEAKRGNSGSQAKISKAKFLQSFDRGFLFYACHPETLLRKCTKITDDECSSYVGAPLKDCISKLSDQLPDEIDLPKANSFGRSLGSCVGKEVYSSALIEKYPNQVDPECFKREIRGS